MQRLLAAAALLCFGLSAQTYAQTSQAASGRSPSVDAGLKQKILDLETRRVAAMVKKDMATLDAILADDLTYTHSGGRTDTKASFMALIKGPDNRYLGVDYSNTEVITTGNAVIVRGVAQIRLGEGPRGPATSYPVLFLDVYALRNGAWQMVAWQATRVGE
jgi:ketosteroid isomerase-like protein